MSHAERFYVTMPEEIPTFTEGFRVAPNEGGFPVDATVYVTTEDDHFLTFKMFPHGPFEKDYLISLVSSEPPIYLQELYDKEVYVRGDMLVQGRQFELASTFPILSKTAFTAMRIFSNVERIEIPVIEL